MLAARKHAGLTQMEVRKALNISQGTLSELEGTAASSGSVVEYAQLYGVSAVWLATGAGDMGTAAAALSARAALIARQMDDIADKEMRSRAMTLCAALVELAQAGQLDKALSAFQAMSPTPLPVEPIAQQHQHREPQSDGARAKRV